MAMAYADFLRNVIEDAFAQAQKDYAHNQSKLKGASAGLSHCRNKDPEELAGLLVKARLLREVAFPESEVTIEEYWSMQACEMQIEWICRCVSTVLAGKGLQVIVPPTGRSLAQVNKTIRGRIDIVRSVR